MQWMVVSVVLVALAGTAAADPTWSRTFPLADGTEVFYLSDASARFTRQARLGSQCAFATLPHVDAAEDLARQPVDPVVGTREFCYGLGGGWLTVTLNDWVAVDASLPLRSLAQTLRVAPPRDPIGQRLPAGWDYAPDGQFSLTRLAAGPVGYPSSQIAYLVDVANVPPCAPRLLDPYPPPIRPGPVGVIATECLRDPLHPFHERRRTRGTLVLSVPDDYDTPTPSPAIAALLAWFAALDPATPVLRPSAVEPLRPATLPPLVILLLPSAVAAAATASSADVASPPPMRVVHQPSALRQFLLEGDHRVRYEFLARDTFVGPPIYLIAPDHAAWYRAQASILRSGSGCRSACRTSGSPRSNSPHRSTT